MSGGDPYTCCFLLLFFLFVTAEFMCIYTCSHCFGVLPAGFPASVRDRLRPGDEQVLAVSCCWHRYYADFEGIEMLLTSVEGELAHLFFFSWAAAVF